ncbi:MAG: DUF952 domain-containing protein [Actinomycetales bacterium]
MNTSESRRLHRQTRHGDDQQPLHHLLTASHWRALGEDDLIDVSTRGRTFADEGFIHLCTGDQVAEVVRLFYADIADDLVVLEIDPADLPTGSVRFEAVGDQEFAHLYALLPVAAVTAATPLREWLATPPSRSSGPAHS